MKVFRAETLHGPDFDEIVALLQGGGVMAFPTDTAYGLGADPFNLAAIERIFTIKGRPDSKPVLLLVDSLAMAHSVIERNDMFDRVAAKFWPGSLTLVAHAVASLPAAVTAGTRTIGLRWPIAATATHLMSRFARPITATSANRSGMETPVTAAEVRNQIGDSVDILIDGGTLPARTGSTILDLTADPPVLIREGPVAFESLAEFFGGNIRRQVA